LGSQCWGNCFPQFPVGFVSLIQDIALYTRKVTWHIRYHLANKQQWSTMG
jgi:hypothetical protein